MSMDVNIPVGTDDLNLDELAQQLSGVAAAVDKVGPPEAPSGEMEARLRKPGASGTLVRMTNGDAVYVPTAEFTSRFFTADDGQPDIKYELVSKFHDELADLCREEQTADPMTLDMRWMVRMLYHILKENYPGLTPDDMNAWVGEIPMDLQASNPVVTDIFEVFRGLKKK